MRIHYYRYVLALVLALTGAQQLLAQEAFYVYRNDGDFNGFFFDEIVRMGYSKTDLEGEEHDVYVVQEIASTSLRMSLSQNRRTVQPSSRRRIVYSKSRS